MEKLIDLIKAEIAKQDNLAKDVFVDRGIESMARYTCFVLQEILNQYQKEEK